MADCVVCGKPLEGHGYATDCGALISAPEIDWKARAERAEAERDKLLRDRVRGYVVEDGVVNYAVIRDALAKLSDIPAMSDVTMRHIEVIGEKLSQAEAERDRLLGIIGPKTHCRACGSVVEMAGESAGECDCTVNETGTQRLAAYDEGAYAEIAKLRAERGQLREALEAAWELSTWAACINWRARDRDNTGEWLDDLRGLIKRFQDLRAAALATPVPSQ